MGCTDIAKDLTAGGVGGIAQVLIGQYRAFTDFFSICLIPLNLHAGQPFGMEYQRPLENI